LLAGLISVRGSLRGKDMYGRPYIMKIRQNGTRIWSLWRIMMDHMVRKARQITRSNKPKIRLGVRWEAQPSNFPDLNPMETIRRTIKQRWKSRGGYLLCWGVETGYVFKRNGIKSPSREINKVISTMPDRVTCLNERFGHAHPLLGRSGGGGWFINCTEKWRQASAWRPRVP
jgi:hypothetical protein